MPFLIDGYNLLWAVQKSGKRMESIEDVELCRLLGRYLRLTDQTAEIIFDGIGPPQKDGFDNIKGLDVFFSGPGSDADTVIEDKIQSNSAPRRLTVVSSDRRLRKAAHLRKAASVKSELFWNDVCKTISRKEKNSEPQAKQRGISDGETEQWMKFFKLK
jgi:predicted RNA-binding protein with PIN domain